MAQGTSEQSVSGCWAWSPAWPIWGVIAAAQRDFTWSVAASALIPLAINVCWLALALRVPARIASSWHHLTHAVGDRLHGGTHRHA